MKQIGIIGASGYTGYELIKILKKHSKVELKVLNSKSYVGKKVKELYPDFNSEDVYTNYSIDEINKMKLDCVFLAVPHTTAFEILPKLKSKKIIDLSADYRFKKIQKYEEVYGTKHLDGKNNKKAVYGLPELFKNKIKKSKIVANPGCYATVCILSAFPIQKLAKYIVFDCKSGYSGAGKKPGYYNDPKNYEDNILAYKLTKHRHKYEIEQFIKTKLSFTPHVIDTFQGMMCTTHTILKKKSNKDEIIKVFKDFYKDEPFIKIMDKIPDLHDIQKNNYCCIGGFEIDENNQLVVISVIDNLLKGASGQAVQNMNLMFGFDENLGL
ncbi:MAG: N-acetyl-gamma-glutamyl-phosphate reductase [Flavobacteriales bacterium]|jgi:N-acetyl-gamma-glutamyl-phosphate reductase|nr:N-acetyl-gamma-glutamyl-phosphate reductase [Flavobacteriales bacterium]|tara:strand:+ start:792 stop:1766 length:975 start_codon:yes stop_codon:yes gene_type:complete